MNQADALALIARYAVSHFWRRTTGGWSDGDKVPKVTGRELVAAMVANVEESRRDVEATAARMREARADGLLDSEAMQGLDKKTRAAWINAVSVLRGDHARAVSELRHWQEYAEWASAHADALEMDKRLPPEPEDQEVPF